MCKVIRLIKNEIKKKKIKAFEKSNFFTHVFLRRFIKYFDMKQESLFENIIEFMKTSIDAHLLSKNEM